MPTEINGLPAHILLVHIVVVFVPLAALLAALAALWPPARRRLGVGAPLAALVALVAVPVTTNAGEALQESVPSTDLVRRHASLGDGLLPWVAGLFVLAVAVWLLGRRSDRPVSGRAGPAGEVGTVRGSARAGWLTAAVSVLTVVVAAVAVVQVYRIGESGSNAVWHGTSVSGRR